MSNWRDRKDEDARLKRSRKDFESSRIPQARKKISQAPLFAGVAQAVIIGLFSIIAAVVATYIVNRSYFNPGNSGPAIDLPIGSVIPFYGNLEDLKEIESFELCDGSKVKANDSPIKGLVKPDLREKFLKGAMKGTDKSRSLKEGGENTISLSVAQLPPHSHELKVEELFLYVSHGNISSKNSGVKFLEVDSQLKSRKKMPKFYIGESGSGRPIDIDPLHFEVFFIIKVK